MGYSQFNTFIPSEAPITLSANRDLALTDVGIFQVFTVTEARILTLKSTVAWINSSEIIIRNYFGSLADIEIQQSGITFDVSSELGLFIPPGGIGELKRLGSSTTWSFFGYISS